MQKLSEITSITTILGSRFEILQIWKRRPGFQFQSFFLCKQEFQWKTRINLCNLWEQKALFFSAYVGIGGEFDARKEFSETLNSRWEAQMRDPLWDQRWWASIESTVIKGAVNDKKVTASSDVILQLFFCFFYQFFFFWLYTVQHYCKLTF
jgi:hypothetical protein